MVTRILVTAILESITSSTYYILHQSFNLASYMAMPYGHNGNIKVICMFSVIYNLEVHQMQTSESDLVCEMFKSIIN